MKRELIIKNETTSLLEFLTSNRSIALIDGVSEYSGECGIVYLCKKVTDDLGFTNVYYGRSYAGDEEYRYIDISQTNAGELALYYNSNYKTMVYTNGVVKNMNLGAIEHFTKQGYKVQSVLELSDEVSSKYYRKLNQIITHLRADLIALNEEVYNEKFEEIYGSYKGMARLNYIGGYEKEILNYEINSQIGKSIIEKNYMGFPIGMEIKVSNIMLMKLYLTEKIDMEIMAMDLADKEYSILNMAQVDAKNRATEELYSNPSLSKEEETLREICMVLQNQGKSVLVKIDTEDDYIKVSNRVVKHYRRDRRYIGEDFELETNIKSGLYSYKMITLNEINEIKFRGKVVWSRF